MLRRTPRRAFTLVELLVVIGLVATLMVLLLPAVNRAIESSRRGTCAMNQTKLALAMAMYDGRNTFLPGVRNNLMIKSPGTFNGATLKKVWNGPTMAPGDLPMGQSTPSWFIMLLPLLERQDLFNAVVEGQLWIAPGDAGSTNTARTGMAINLTTCPSMGDWGTIARSWSNMHYRANGAGNSSSPFNRDDGAIGDNANGIVCDMAGIAAGDGTSSTLLIAEGGNQTWYPQTIAASGNPADPCWFNHCNGNNANYTAVPEAGGTLLFGFTTNLRRPPLGTTGIINCVSKGDDLLQQVTPSSAHPGGAVVAFADGSTRFLQETLKPHVYGHLVTRRSVWNGTTYANNSALANGFLQCSPAPKPYTLDTADY